MAPLKGNNILLNAVGSASILTGLGLALDQIVPSWWRWDQVLALGHHESTSFALIILGVSMLVYAHLRQRNKQIKPDER